MFNSVNMCDENINVATRITREEKLLLEKVCKARGEHISTFFRRALKKELAHLNYYPEEVKKALGMKHQTEENDPVNERNPG